MNHAKALEALRRLEEFYTAKVKAKAYKGLEEDEMILGINVILGILHLRIIETAKDMGLDGPAYIRTAKTEMTDDILKYFQKYGLVSFKPAQEHSVV